MPEKLPLEQILAAELAVVHAQGVRQYHRRRSERGSAQREKDISLALGRLKEVMRPLRREIARFPYGPQTDEAEENRQKIRKTSKALQTERRKLHKMKRRKQ